MKIFSNFDTRLKYKELEKHQKEFWDKHVLLIWKSRLFNLIKVFFPLVFLGLLVAGFLYIMYFGLWYKAFLYWWLPLSWIIIFFSIIPIIKSFIDFHMDFMIITPRLFIKYNQEWLFRRDYMTTYVVDVKTVIVKKNWLLYSLFNVWDVIFLSEWDQERTELSLNYVSDPEVKKWAILDIKNYWEEFFQDKDDNK